MQLSEHDLKQFDEETIRSLQAETLQTLSMKLLADLKEARDRLNQRPDNSSRPPSTRAPWEGGGSEPRDDDEAEERKPEETGQNIAEGAQANDPSTGRTTKRARSRNRAGPRKKVRASRESPRGRRGMVEPLSWQ